MTKFTLLSLDNEPAILKAIKRIFHRSNLQIKKAVTSIDALHILEKTPFSVLATDYSMSEKAGAELLAQARTIHPDTVRILLGDNNDQTATIAVINHSHTPNAHPLSANSA